MSIKISRYYGAGLGLLAVGAVVGMGACSSDVTPTPVGGAGAAAGGAPGGAGASAAGTHAGGASAGASTGGGGGGAPLGTFACAGTKPAGALITSFADLVANTTNAGNFTFVTGVPGGTFSYVQTGTGPALTLTATPDMALNIKGSVNGYDGFGLYLTSCTDASAYTGVTFKIKGNVGNSGTLSFRIQTNSDYAVDATNMKGACVVPTGTTDTYSVCHGASKDIPVTAAGGVVNVAFSELSMGIPVGTVSAKEILGFEWAFTFPNPAGTGGAGAGGGASAGAGGASAGAGGASAGAGGVSAGAGGASAGAGGARAGAGGASAGAGGASAGAGGASAGAGGASAGAGGAPAAMGYPVDVTIDDFMFTGGPPAGGAGGAGGGASAGAGGASAGAGGASAGAGGASAGAGGASAGTGGAHAGTAGFF